MADEIQPRNIMQLVNEQEPVELSTAEEPSAPKKVRSCEVPYKRPFRREGLPRPFDYLQKPPSARRLFVDPQPSLPDLSMLPVPFHTEPRSHRQRSKSRITEVAGMRRRLF